MAGLQTPPAKRFELSVFKEYLQNGGVTNPASEAFWSYLLKGCSRFVIGKGTRCPES